VAFGRILRFERRPEPQSIALPGHYLSQHDEPSAGCAQHAPPLSSGVSLGVQQTDALFFGAQQEEAAGAASFFSLVIFVFSSTGISSVLVSICLFVCFY
jgi:hypothetical protein